MDADRDLIVVGAGVVGLATALAAQDRGLTVRCIEVARPGAGQSAGLTRIFRHRHDSAALVDLAVRARRAWSAWEKRFGRTLVGGEGVLVTGPDLADHARRFAEAGVEHDVADPDGQRRALPALAPPGTGALLDARGGAIRAAAAVDELSRALGDAIVLAEVLGLHPDDGGAVVETSEGMWRARHVVLCAGAGTQRLARGVGLELPVSHGCTLRATFAIRDPGDAPRLACLLDRDRGAYGSQCEGGPAYAVGLHTSEVALPDAAAPIPAAMAQGPALAATSRYVARALPGLHPEPIGVRLCRTTRLAWSDDAFAAWRQGPVTAFAGNNAFKFAPLLGPLLVEAAVSGAMGPELSPAAGAGRLEA